MDEKQRLEFANKEFIESWGEYICKSWEENPVTDEQIIYALDQSLDLIKAAILTYAGSKMTGVDMSELETLQ